jgi:hypothetical protein
LPPTHPPTRTHQNLFLEHVGDVGDEFRVHDFKRNVHHCTQLHIILYRGLVSELTKLNSRNHFKRNVHHCIQLRKAMHNSIQIVVWNALAQSPYVALNSGIKYFTSLKLVDAVV